MYGKDFHQWREAQEIIRQIEAEEPEVREMVTRRYRPLTSQLQPMSLAQSMMLEQQRRHMSPLQQQAGGLQSLLGALGL